jgi:hypothetical protein
MTYRLAVLVLATGGASCGGSSVDPRCVTLCIVNEPVVSGAYDVCSAGSVETCKQACDARIADVATLCASCLLEDACFAPDCGGASSGDACDGSGQCTVSGRTGQCTYPQGDTAAREDCLRQVYPRRTVECAAEYRPVSECAASCGGQADAGP